MPKSETFYITILRNTVDAYRSIYRYFHSGNKASKYLANSIEEFNLWAENIESFSEENYKNYKKLRGDSNRGQSDFVFTRNTALHDLGYAVFGNDDSAANNVTLINQVTWDIIQRFDMILITEKMDEGLILLADRLCWSLDDVIEFRQNIEIQKDDLSKSWVG